MGPLSTLKTTLFVGSLSKTKFVTFLHLCRRVPHIYAGIGFTWILTPAQKRVGFHGDLAAMEDGLARILLSCQRLIEKILEQLDRSPRSGSDQLF